MSLTLSTPDAAATAPDSWRSRAPARRWLPWLPLTMAMLFCLQGLLVIDGERHLQRLLGVQQRLLETVTGAADDGDGRPQHLTLVIGLRRLLPELAAVSPASFEGLMPAVTALEAALAGHDAVPPMAADRLFEAAPRPMAPPAAGAAAAEGAAAALERLEDEGRRLQRRNQGGRQRLLWLLLLCLGSAAAVLLRQLWWHRGGADASAAATATPAASAAVPVAAAGPAAVPAAAEPQAVEPPQEAGVAALVAFRATCFDPLPCAAVLSDDGDNILAVNPAYERATGYGEAEVRGRPLTFNHSGQQDERFYLAMRQALGESGRWSGEFWLRNSEGEAYADKVTRLVLTAADGSVSGYLTLSQDVLGSDDAKRLMLWQAHHDTLTKLPNRNLFQERLDRVLLRVGETDFLAALISIDLDRFKMVNDSEGPARGDQILMQAGYRVAMRISEADTVARLGADHFVALLTDVADYGDIERVARDIVTELGQPYVLDGRELYISASCGVAVIPQDGATTGELLQKADAARIQAKRDGGNQLAFFEPEMNARAERRMTVERALRQAVEKQELLLHLQPVVDVRGGVVASAEALLRWESPELGMVSPGEFIPVAEDAGLIIDIGAWVIRACHGELQSLRDAGFDDLRLSLNVSALQLGSDADVDALLAVFAEGDSSGLTIELTESALADDSQRVQRFLAGVRELGCKIALDDFGTGYSSLSYLRHYVFDVLKIDKSFIDEMENTRDYGLVASIVSMGRILGMRIVAEGVETDEQLRQLRQIGCDFVQGYYFSRPLPAAEFHDFVRHQALQSLAEDSWSI